MVLGNMVFDCLTLAKVNVDFVKMVVTATAAFVNSKNGATHGWTEATGTVWSTETLQKLQDLRISMENDLAKLHVGNFSAATAKTGLAIDKEEGLSEHLSGDAPSV